MIAVRFVFPDKSRVPTSKAMEKARLETFTAGDGWKYDKVRGHGVTSKKVSFNVSLHDELPDDSVARESWLRLYAKSSGRRSCYVPVLQSLSQWLG